MAVQPAKSLSPIPKFPGSAERAAGTYNGDAYAFGNHMGGPGPFVGEINALSHNVQHNAQEAVDAGNAAQQAQGFAAIEAGHAMGYRNEAGSHATTATNKAAEAVAAAGQAVPAAASAIAAAKRAEDAAAGIQDGPVTSVNGQTGVVDLTAELHSMALLF